MLQYYEPYTASSPVNKIFAYFPDVADGRFEPVGRDFIHIFNIIIGHWATNLSVSTGHSTQPVSSPHSNTM